MQAAAYSILLVQVAIARYLGIRPSEVRARHRLRDDLGLDAFDVALIAVALGDRLRVDVCLEDVDDAATVNAFARCIAQALDVEPNAGDDVVSIRDDRNETDDRNEMDGDASTLRPDRTMDRGRSSPRSGADPR